MILCDRFQCKSIFVDVDNFGPCDWICVSFAVALEAHLLTRFLTVEHREVTDCVLLNVKLFVNVVLIVLAHSRFQHFAVHE